MHERDADSQQLLDRLRRAQAVARVGSWELDLQTQSIWGSEEAFRIYGLPLTPDQRLPLADVQRVPLPAYRKMLDRVLGDLIAGRGPYDVEYEVVRPADGHRCVVHSRAELQLDTGGRPVAVLGTIQDITERKAMEEALRSSEERFRMILEHAADGILLVSDHLIVVSNGQASEMTGLSRTELMGRPFATLFSPEELARAPFRFDRLDRGEALITERTITRKDGGLVPVEMHSKKLPNDVYLTILRDLSERRRLEEHLKLRQRMDSIGSLAVGLAHDFNNILVAIIGYGDLLRAEPALSSAGRDALASLLGAAQRAADLVDRLEALSRSEHGEVCPFDLHRAASDVVRALGETTDRRVRCEVRLAAGAFQVRGAERDIHHALAGIVINAVEAIEARGVGATDAIVLDAAAYDARADDPRGLPPGRYVHLRVADTGPGMPPAVKERAFDPLFSTRQRGTRKGQGLGLTMAYNVVVHQHRGSIDIETEEGRGTTIHVFLPLADAVPANARPVPVPAGTSEPSRAATILVVEDEEPIAKLAKLILERAGYRVHLAGDGAEALDRFSAAPGDFDLVILDRTLPKLSGAEVLQAMARVRPDVKVIVSSGNTFPAGEEFPTGTRLLPKPYTPRQLVDSVGAALA